MKYLEVDKMKGKISKSEFRGEFTLTFILTFSLTSTLHLQIDGASSRSIERYFLLCFDNFPKYNWGFLLVLLGKYNFWETANRLFS